LGQELSKGGKQTIERPLFHGNGSGENEPETSKGKNVR
jgi:hypothetical protein